jgi:transcriptional regulator
VVHVNGKIDFIDEPAWLLSLVESLTDEHEQGRDSRWRITDAPADYRQAQLHAIVGFEITVNTLVGKFKSSQNRPAADRAAVADALRAARVDEQSIQELVRDPRD